MVTKTGITGRTRGKYGYIWDLVERWLPETLAAADRLGMKAARALLNKHFELRGIPIDSALYRKVLGWEAHTS